MSKQTSEEMLVQFLTENKEKKGEVVSLLTRILAQLEMNAKASNSDSSQSDSNSKSKETNVSSIRKEVIEKIAHKEYSQSLHKSFKFKQLQRAFVTGESDLSSVQVAYDKALSQCDEPDVIRQKIQKIKEDREANKPIQNRGVIGIFSKISSVDWIHCLTDKEKETYHAMNLFLKENCERFYDENVDLYKRVRNKDSIIKDFRTAVCKSWARNALNMEFTDETKLQIPELTKEDIKEWIDKLNLKKSTTEVKDVKKSKADKKTEKKSGEMELDVESEDESEAEVEKVPTPKPVKKRKARKTSSKKKSSAKKSSAKKSDSKKSDSNDSDTDSKKTTKPKRRGRPVRKMADLSDSDSDSSDDSEQE
jgi:hypothetical protein